MNLDNLWNNVIPGRTYATHRFGHKQNMCKIGGPTKTNEWVAKKSQTKDFTTYCGSESLRQCSWSDILFGPNYLTLTINPNISTERWCQAWGGKSTAVKFRKRDIYTVIVRLTSQCSCNIWVCWVMDSHTPS